MDLEDRFERAVRWLKRDAEDTDEARDITLAILALTDAYEHPYSHIIQRLALKLKRQQIGEGRWRGSWGGFLWDTSFAVIALHRAHRQPGPSKDSIHIKSALDYIRERRNLRRSNWSDEIWETVACCKAIIEVEDESQYDFVHKALDWLATRKCPNGSLVSTHYTSSILSLLALAQKKFGWDYDSVIKDEVKWFKEDAEQSNLPWSSDPWIIALGISALIDSGEDPRTDIIRKALDWLIEKQGDDGSWDQMIDVTSYAIISLAKLLSKNYLTCRSIAQWRDMLPVPSRMYWRRPVQKLLEGELEVIKPSKIPERIARIQRIDFDEEFIKSDILTRIERVSDIANFFFQEQRGKVIKVSPDILQQNVVEALRDLGSFLYAYFFGESGQINEASLKLMKEQVDHLILDVHPTLLDIPWEILHDKDDFLCLKYAMGRAAPIQAIRRRPQKHKGKVLLIGDPTEDPLLESVKDEISQIESELKNIMEIDCYYGYEMGKWEFLNLLKSGEYDIIHFAGHADHRNGESFLMFGELTSDLTKKVKWVGAQEIRNFVLSAPVPPLIVFINACSSAVKGEELNIVFDRYFASLASNLVDALMSCGTYGYIGSLWPIHDKSAADFANNFYKHLVQGCTMGDALRLAKIYAYRNGGMEQITWASFILYGDPTTKIELM